MAAVSDTQVDEHLSPYRQLGKLYGFICIVTGATEPIGSAVVAELAAHGAACVYACSSAPDHDFSRLEAEIKQQYPGTKVIGYPLKQADEGETLALIDDVLNVWGRLDVWVTSSSLTGPSDIAHTTPLDLYKSFEANALSPFLALKYAPPAMAKTTPKGTYANATPKQGSYGSIIVVSSIASHVGGCSNPALTISCHAALGAVRAGVASLKGTAIRINAISSGQIDDGKGQQRQGLQTNGSQAMPNSMDAGSQQDSTSLQRMGYPEEIARVTGFLASGFSSYINGTNIVVDGGSSVIGAFAVQ